jgi:hypothetical protein
MYSSQTIASAFLPCWYLRFSLWSRGLMVIALTETVIVVASFISSVVATTSDGLNQFMLFQGRIEWNHRRSLQPQFFFDLGHANGVRICGVDVDDVVTYGGTYRRISMPGLYIIMLTLVLPLFESKRAITESRRDRRWRHGLCPCCGYDLRGSSRVCPECGSRIPELKEGDVEGGRGTLLLPKGGRVEGRHRYFTRDWRKHGQQ